MSQPHDPAPGWCTACGEATGTLSTRCGPCGGTTGPLRKAGRRYFPSDEGLDVESSLESAERLADRLLEQEEREARRR